MIEVRGSVTFVDGSAHEFVGGPWAISQWERYAMRNQLDSDPSKAPMTWSLFVAYAAVNREQWGKCEGYEAWSARVVDVDLETTEANPTQPATSDA
jgi:hypothetical protein